MSHSAQALSPPRSGTWLGATRMLVAGGGAELALASAAVCGQRVALPLAVLWLGGEGQLAAGSAVVVAAGLGFVRVAAGHRLAGRARRNLLELYIRPLERGSALGLPAGDEISAQLSVAFPVLAFWIADGLTLLLGGTIAAPIVGAILIGSLGPVALVPVLVGGAAGALVTLAVARWIETAWDRSWALCRSLTVAIADAHRGAIEIRAHGRSRAVSDGLRASERAWSAADAHARRLLAAHSWGAVGVAVLVAAIASLLLGARAANPGGQSYFGWLLVLAALPAAQALVAGTTATLGSRAELGVVARQLGVPADEPAEADEPIDSRSPLRLEHVSFAYPAERGESAAPLVLRDLSVTLPPLGGVAVIGPNGAGKTTLLHVLLGILHPSTGRILVGEREARLDNRRWRSRVAFVPQQPFMLSDGSIAANLRVFDPETADEALIGALREVKLWELLRARAADDTAALELPLSHLSKGLARRVALARALLRDADTLLLDEPEASLDAASVLELATLLETLARRKRVIAAVHDRALLEWASLVIDLGSPSPVSVELAS